MSVLLRHRTLKDGKKSYYLDINHEGKRYREFLNVLIRKKKKGNENSPKQILAIAEAIRNKRELELMVKGHDIDEIIHSKRSFTELFRQYKEEYDGKDFKKVNSAFNYFEKYFGNVLAKELKFDNCEKYYKHLKTKLNGETPSTYFGVFRRVINIAIRKGFLQSNPTNGIKVKKPKSLVKQILNPDEIQLLYNTHCGNSEVKKAFLFCCNTGLGASEVRRLKWKHINDWKLSHFGRSKTESGLTIDLNGNARMLLGERGKPNEYIFSLKSDTAINKTLLNWVKRAGIDKHITWYCARHSFACNLLINGANPKTVANLLGHSSLQHTEKYLNHVDSLNKQAVEALPLMTGNLKVI